MNHVVSGPHRPELVPSSRPRTLGSNPARPRSGRTHSLRTRLLLLVLATALPLLLLVGAAVQNSHSIDRDMAERDLVRQAHALAEVVDHAALQEQAFLEGLVIMPSLASGHFQQFEEHVRESVARRTAVAVRLTDADGTTLIRANPQDVPSPGHTPARIAARIAAQTGAAHFYSPYRNRDGRRNGLGVAVPTPLSPSPLSPSPLSPSSLSAGPLSPGGLPGPRILSLELPQARLQSLLPESSLREGWVVAIIDQNGVVVARNLRPEAFVGTSIIAPVREGLSERGEGFVRTRNIEGIASSIAFAKAPLTGFAVAFAIPSAQFDEPQRKAMLQAILIGLVIVVPGLLAAVLLAREISRSLEQAAGTFARGGTVDSGFSEIADLCVALRRAWGQRDAATAEIIMREDWLARILNAIPMIIMLRNRSGRITFTNETASAYFGPGLERSNFGLAQRVHPDDLPRFEEWLRIRHSAEAASVTQVRLRRADDAFRWHMLRVARMSVGDDGQMNFCGIALDTHDEHEAHLALDRANAGLERQVAERTRELEATADALSAELGRRAVMQAALLQSQKMEALGQLTGGAAHDFNNVLAAVQNCLNVINGRSQDPTIREASDIGLRAVGRAAAIVRNLLAFARKQPLQPGLVRLDEMLADFAVLSQQTLGERITQRVDIPSDIWDIKADPNALEVALLNLVVNARDAMPQRGTLEISARNRPKAADAAAMDGEICSDFPGVEGSGADCVVISIRDTGAGMSPDVLEHATEPFFTTKPSGQGPGTGTGMGLAMVYGFASQSGGALRILSVVGEGTTVELILPRATDRLEDTTSDPHDIEPHGSGDGSGSTHGETAAGGKIVLLVDDNEGVRRSLAMLLRLSGWHVVQAGGVKEALARAEEIQQIDLVLTDVVMPGGGGTHLADTLRAQRPNVPILLMTGYADDNTDVGNWHVLSKPFTRRQLDAALQTVVKG